MQRKIAVSDASPSISRLRTGTSSCPGLNVARLHKIATKDNAWSPGSVESYFTPIVANSEVSASAILLPNKVRTEMKIPAT